MSRLHLLGSASGAAGVGEQCGTGPLVIQQSEFLSALNQTGVEVIWHQMLGPHLNPHKRVDQSVRDLCESLASQAEALTREKIFFTVVGGDHSCAIGTWSGVQEALSSRGDLGLIWIDAHMDSHTPETSLSQRIHGMPLACLLGHGYDTLTTILNDSPKIKPENLCLIGVRSFEAGEAALLKKMNVRVYFMEEVLRRGLPMVMQEAIERVSRNTVAYGVTLDIDAIDPKDAPGVDVPEANGIRAKDLYPEFKKMIQDKRLIATEIVEFDPLQDKNRMTEQLVVNFLKIIAERK